MKTWLPIDTCDALRKAGVFEPVHCESRSLLLTKMAYMPEDKTQHGARAESLERSLGKPAAKSFGQFQGWLEAIGGASRCRRITLYTAERLLLGLTEGIHENAGLQVHRLFGVPIINGSQLKGIAADAASVLEVEKKISAMDITEVFGGAKGPGNASGSRGKIAFMAACSERAGCKLELDVLTVHYRQYYSHGNPHHPDLDTDRLVTAVFPAVAEAEPFCFPLLCMNTALAEAESTRLLNVAEQCLRYALLHWGVGGKTRASYGRFRATSEKPPLPPAADDLFKTSPTKGIAVEEEKVSKSTTATPDPALAVFITRWSGEALGAEKIKNFAIEIRKLPPELWAAAFDACMPLERRTMADSVWVAFRSRSYGIALLEELKPATP